MMNEKDQERIRKHQETPCKIAARCPADVQSCAECRNRATATETSDEETEDGIE